MPHIYVEYFIILNNDKIVILEFWRYIILELSIVGDLPTNGFLSFILPLSIPHASHQQVADLLSQPINIWIDHFSITIWLSLHSYVQIYHGSLILLLY